MATAATPIFVDKNTRPMGLGAIVYNTSLKRFIGAAQDGSVSGVAVYEAPQPWGPWSTIRYDNTAPNGSGGWGDLGSTSYTSGHGDSLGVNFINAFTSADGLTMWAVFSSDGIAPSTALLPGLANNSIELLQPGKPDARHVALYGVIFAIFLASGVSGLIYQVIWVRQFANVFGNTVYSASLVAGVFMAGLGAGAYVLGKEADARYADDPMRPLRLYARAELGIAAFGLVLARFLPRLGALSVLASSYVTGPHGWHELSTLSYVVRYAVAIALVAPPTFLMGGTLTLLIRFVVAHRVDAAAHRIGRLYAANTAGAAVGALLTDLVLVPALGLWNTQVLAVLINVAAGMGALSLARSRALSHPASEPNRQAGGAPSDHDAAEARSLGASAVALVMTGFAAMGLEILWFRFLSSVLGQLRSVFSLLLAVILTGIGLGSLLGAWAHRRFGRPAVLWMGTQALLAVSSAILLGLLDPRAVAGTHDLALAFVSAPGWERGVIELWASIRPVAAFVLLPALLMGMSFPLANANAQRVVAAIGQRAGALYLANTAGNVLGCFVVGFALLPSLGVQNTTLQLAVAAAGSIIPIYLSAGRSERVARATQVTLVASFGLCFVALGSFAALPRGFMLDKLLPHDQAASIRQILERSEGLSETVVIGDVPGFYRELLTNGHAMSSTHPKSQRYMRAFAHVPLLQIDEPKSALVICFGVGNTTHAVSLHPSVTRIDVADLSRSVLDHAGWFRATNGGVLDDPRVSVFVNDGRHHLLMQPPGTYDLITLEPPPIAFAGVASLYSRELYELARSRLTGRGLMTQWLPAYQVPEETVRSVVRAFVDVFPESVLLSGDDNELILMGTKGPQIAMDLDRVATRLSRSPRVMADLEGIDLGNFTELAGMFAASSATLTRATRGVSAVTDDRPTLEYSLVSNLGSRRMPKDLFDVTGVEAWCPGCLARLPRLGDYLRFTGLIYASDSFLATPSEGPVPVESVSTLAASHYLETLVKGPSLEAREAAVRSLDAGHETDGVNLLALALSYDASDADNFRELGRALARTNDFDGAAGAFQKAVQLDPTDAQTHCNFAASLRRLGVVPLALQEEKAALALGRKCGADIDPSPRRMKAREPVDLFR